MPPDAPPTDDFLKDGHVPVRYALIGEAIGLALIYAGTRIPYRILSWPVIGIGVLFVLVMTAYIISVFWTNASPHVRRLVARARAQARNDPQLGTLIRDVRAQSWEARFRVRRQTVNILIDGTEEPHPELIARARELVTDFSTFEHRLTDYLARKAKERAGKDPELAAEIGQLRVSAINLLSPHRPGRVEIDFAGPDDMRLWSCEYVDGTFSRLRFDT